jgi:hypothetical protein
MTETRWRCLWLWKPENYGQPDDVTFVTDDWDGKIPEGFDRYIIAGSIVRQEPK